MTDEEDLGQQLYAHPRFAWREGMRDRRGVRIVDLELWDGVDPPDLADAATAGVLLGMLAETGRLTDVVWDSGEWIVAVELPEDGVQGFASDVFGEAVCWALLAAWDVDLEGQAEGPSA